MPFLLYDKAPTPPVPVTVIPPLFAPKHVTLFFVSSETETAVDGSVIVMEAGAVHALLSVTVTL